MEFNGTNPYLHNQNKEDPIPFHGHLWRKGQLEYRNLHEFRDIFYSIIGYTVSCEKGKELKEIYQCLILRCPVFAMVHFLLKPKSLWEINGMKEFNKLLKEVREKND